jgi:4-amino-4-deoxy-L-arabinose transferase-like glycosyltransferase
MIFKDRFYLYVLLATILCVPAFLINLGTNAYIGDEAIRSLVAFEMMKSGNYLVPTMNGDFYFAKPPLYNWILIIFYKMFGQFNEWITRLPTVLFSFGFAFLIWYFNRNKLQNKKFAIVLAFMFLTCGRILFYDSFLGLIDIFFSMVTYSMIMLSYSYAEKNQFSKMYYMLYIFAALGFMLKGLPSIHFLIFTIVTVHFIFDDKKHIYSKHHLIGILISGLVLSLYFYGYNQYMEAGKTITPLLDQATRRTIVKYEIWNVIKHIFTYPFENIFHFFPWSLLGLLVFQKDLYSKLKTNKYIFYVSIAFLSNFVIYWISPEVYPRYILMLIPLIFTVWIYLYEYELGVSNLAMQIIALLFKLITAITPIVMLWFINDPKLEYVSNAKLIIIVSVVLLGIIAFIYFKDKPNRIIIIVNYLLIVRIFFDLIILPSRNITSAKEFTKLETTRIAKKYEDLKLYKSTSLYWQNTVYLSTYQDKIINRSDDLNDAKHFIIDTMYSPDLIKLDSFCDARDDEMRWVIKGKK